MLERFVDPRGRVDFGGIRKDPHGLQEQVEFVSRTTPESFRDQKGRLAFLLNAYNSLAMSQAAHSGILPRNKIRFFYLPKHDVGGRGITLHAIENKLIRPLGEPRVHFALNCMVRGCPRLPREPFTAERLEAQLEAAAREFFNDARHVRIDDSARTARYSSILKWYREDFLAQAPSLTAYANRYRERKIPEDYRIGFLDYDWTLNAPD